jgi:hypothetical protein
LLACLPYHQVLQIDWKPTGGEKKKWASWYSGSTAAGSTGSAAESDHAGAELFTEVDSRLEPPVPPGWLARQNDRGLLEYYHTASDRVSAEHPSAGAEGDFAKSPPGYAIRVGDWKGVVAHCADTDKLVPSDKDVYEIYDLMNDPFETHNLASTTEGATQKAALFAVVKAAGVSCHCFQC